MPLRRAVTAVIGAFTALAVVLGTLLVGVVLATSASASPVEEYELPFPCGEAWTGNTRSSHRPSAWSIDFNRSGDLGDLLVAPAPGRVSRVADTGNTSYGRYLIIDHGDGYSTLYAHLKIAWVTTGQRVDQGSVLGLVGESGGVTAAHLHFEERYNARVHRPSFHGEPYAFGSTTASLNCPDVPVTGDWDGNRTSDVGVFRRGSPVGAFRLQLPDRTQRIRYGLGSDTPLVGDWDGDGRTDVGVRRTGPRLFLLRNADGTTTTVRMGQARDLPVTGDWNGDGTTEVGTWRPVAARFRMLIEPGVVRTVRLGNPGSIPVTGDWNGDKVTDLGVFDPATATFTLRAEKEGASPSFYTVRFGAGTDLPVTGDWNGDGRTDVGVWAPSTATYSLRTTSVTSRTTKTVQTKRFGRRR
jgi:hypothetical protein